MNNPEKAGNEMSIFAYKISNNNILGISTYAFVPVLA
jgi:hypothetical protein